MRIITKKLLNSSKTAIMAQIGRLFKLTDEQVVSEFKVAFPASESVPEPKEALRNMVMDAIDHNLPDHWCH